MTIPLLPPKPTLADVYAEFAAALQVPFCIAGGAVRDHLLGLPPKDYDLFVFERYDRRRLAGYQQGPAAVGYDAWHVANVEWRGQAVQIIGPLAYRDIDELLDGFDWNVCQFAYDGQRVIQRMDAGEISRRGWLRLTSDRTPHVSLRRGFRFSERYRMDILPADLERLCRLIAGQHVRATRRGMAVAA